MGLGAGGTPYTYIEYRACRLYGCTPSQLTRERALTVLAHLECEALEAEVQSKRRT
jgi:hypothetical protein